MSTTMASTPTRPRTQPDPHPQPRHGPGDAAAINVSDTERWVSLIGGGALAILGLSRASLPGLGLAAIGGALLHRGATGHCNMYGMFGVNTAEHHGEQASIAAGHGVHFEETTTVNRSPEELYRFWRDFENLPKFMRHLESVEKTGPKTSRWIARGPLGVTVSWDAEIITERENELIGWRSLDGSTVDTAGSVHFSPAPGNRGTEVRVVMKYNPPLGKAGAALAWMFGKSAKQEVQEDLRRFRQHIETGVTPTTEGQPQGACAGMTYEKIANGVGLFSIGLGLTQIVAPNAVARMIGVRENPALMCFLGLREIASGAGILASRRPAGFLWSRVVGDIVDLTLLVGAMPNNPNRDRTNLATAAVVGAAALDLVCSTKLSGNGKP